MKFLIVALDYFFGLAFLLLFLLFTPLADDWSPFTVRFFFISGFLGMSLAQMWFPVNLGRTANDSGQLFRNALGVSLVFIVGTYITMRILYHPGVDTGRWLSLIGVAFLFCFLVFRWLEKKALTRVWASGYKVVRVIAIGNGDNFSRIIRHFAKSPGLGFRIVGCYTDDPSTEYAETLGSVAEGMEIIRSNKSFPGTIDALLCGFPTSESRSLNDCAFYCNSRVLRYYYAPSDDTLGVHLKPMLIGNDEVFTLFRLPLSIPTNQFIKRAFDIVFSVCVLIPLGLFIPIIALIIKRQSPGPIFFKQARTGMDGRTFMCYKFRSMHVNKDADKVQATKDDPRKFPFGNFMRKSNIDELPQFWNVLKNDMSIVGPRPHMLKHTEMYSKLLDKYMVRHFVKPGITGWAQESGFRGETKELWQMEGRVKCDIWYIEHWSFWLDIRIILLTVKSVFIHDKQAY